MFVLRLYNMKRTTKRERPFAKTHDWLCTRRKSTGIATMLRLSVFLASFVIINFEEDENLLWSSCSNHRTGDGGSRSASGAQNTKKKGQKEKKNVARGTAESDCVRFVLCANVNSYVAATTVLRLTTKLVSFCSFVVNSKKKFLFNHVCTQLLTVLIDATFSACLTILSHRSSIWNFYAQRRIGKSPNDYLQRREKKWRVCPFTNKSNH